MDRKLDLKLQEVATWPQVHSAPHFEKIAFKRKEKIFLTIDAKKEVWCVKLSLSDQLVYCLIDRQAIYPAPNSWGKKGWTLIHPAAMPEQALDDLLLTAWESVGRKK